jgi:hypothetical protein
MKMGKSLGNTLEPKDLVDRFGADAVRYFFLREVEFGNDGDYSEERFINTVNAHLANTIGIMCTKTSIYLCFWLMLQLCSLSMLTVRLHLLLIIPLSSEQETSSIGHLVS